MKKKLFLLTATVVLALANGHASAVSFGMAASAVVGGFAYLVWSRR